MATADLKLILQQQIDSLQAPLTVRDLLAETTVHVRVYGIRCCTVYEHPPCLGRYTGILTNY